MKPSAKLALAVIGAATLAGAASSAASAPKSAGGAHNQSCFFTREMRNHTVGDDHTLYIDVDGRDVYRLEMSNACLAAHTSTDPIIVRQVGNAGSICSALDLDISVGGGGAPTRCIVKKMVKMTPAEVAALPKNLKP
jgi:hypothetical protein